jgi:hypothetical protein
VKWAATEKRIFFMGEKMATEKRIFFMGDVGGNREANILHG